VPLWKNTLALTFVLRFVGARNFWLKSASMRGEGRMEGGSGIWTFTWREIS
jgi:hypothetical protein